MFLVLAIICAALALIWTTAPLWRKRFDAGEARRAANVAAYRHRLAELDADRSAGLLDSDAHQALRAELDARLLDDAEVNPTASPSTGGGKVLALILLLAVPILAVLGYVQSGSWEVDQKIVAAKNAPPPSPQEVEQLVDALALRMQSEPDKLDGWVLLARTSFQLGRYSQAADAYQRANSLTQEREPALLVGEAESLAMQGDRRLEGRPRALLLKALELEPDHPRALWLAALAAEQAGETTQAREYWTRVAQQNIPDELRATVEQRLASKQVEANQKVQPADAEFGISLNVSLAEPFKRQAPADAIVFVFARAVEGPPMPLAVHRSRVSELPMNVVLDDSMAMMPSLKLSGFDQWELTARVSLSGEPQAQSGDLQGSLTVARATLGDAALPLTIDQIVP